MVKYSKVFGPTDSVANTKTKVGETYYVRPGLYSAIKLTVGKGNVVNAKENAGKITVEVAGVNGPFEYAYGNGVGGATNSSNIAAEPIGCLIPLPGGAEVKVYVTDAEVAKNVIVCMSYVSGSGHVRSYFTGGAGVDATADTELAMTNIVPSVGGVIKQIRIAGSGIVDAKSASGKLVLTVPGQDGPFEYAFGNGPGGATLSMAAWADVYDELDIPVTMNSQVSLKITTSEDCLSLSVSLSVE